MKNYKKKLILVLVVIMAVCIMLAACQESDKVRLSVTPNKTELNVGDVITLSAMSMSGDPCVFTADNSELVKLETNGDTATLTVIKAPTADTEVTVTAAVEGSSDVKDSKTFTIKGQEIAPIRIVASGYTLDLDNELEIIVAVPEGDDYDFTISNTSLVYYVKQQDKGILYVQRDVTEATKVTLTVSLKSNNAIKAVQEFTVLPLGEKPTIKMNPAKDKISKDDRIFLSVIASGGAPYVLSVDNEELVELDGDYLKCVKAPDYDTKVKITASIKDDPSISVTKTVIVRAPRKVGEIPGPNGNLTSDKLAQLFTNNLTIIGNVTDIREIFKPAARKEITEFEMSILMNDGKWKGSWNLLGSSNILVDTYVRGEDTIDVLQSDGTSITKHIVNKLYVDKNNKVASTTEKDYQSVPSFWEDAHLWNPFEDYITIENFDTYDADEGGFEITKREGQSAMDYVWFVTYLAHSFTPMLNSEVDYLDRVYLIVDGDKITGLKAYTLPSYKGGQDETDATSMEYSSISLEFSNIGSTSVTDPEVYGAPEHADALEKAVNQIKNSTNYTFNAKETITGATVTNPDDYITASVASAAVLASNGPTRQSKHYNYTSDKGTQGMIGYVTDKNVLLAKTVKIQSMDGDAYSTTYTGYHSVDANSCEFFEYSYDMKKLVATRKFTKTMRSVLPQFDFSINVFEFIKETEENGKPVYVFQLRDAAITLSMAKQVSMHYADSAIVSTAQRFTIKTDTQGNIVSISYPYELSSGIGYITLTYSDIGSTVIDEDFDDINSYVPRTIPQTWAGVSVTYYQDFSTQKPSITKGSDEVLQELLGSDVDVTKLPSVKIFAEVFDDYLSIARYDIMGADDTPYFSISAKTDKLDEKNNLLLAQYQEIIATLTEEFAKCGFSVSVPDTKFDANILDRSNRYATFVNQELNCEIVLSNNHSGWFQIYFFRLGDWHLSK